MEQVRNKRSFPRRRLGIDFNLTVAGETYPAVVRDFSLKGVGILIKGMTDLHAPTLDLKIRDIGINEPGRIIWKREMFSGLMVGVCRLGPLEGRLVNYHLPDLLLGIQRDRKTGVLHIEGEAWRKKVFFRDGEMIYSSSDLADEQLGRILLASGRISEQQYLHSLSLSQETGKNQGALLVELGYLSPQDLVMAVHRCAEIVVMNLCSAADAAFSFSEEGLPQDEIVSLKLNSSDLLYQGAKLADMGLFRDNYLHDGTEIMLNPETGIILDRLALDDEDRQVLSMINGRTPLSEILSRSPLREEDTLRAIHALYNAQLLELRSDIAPARKKEEEPARPADLNVDAVVAGDIEMLYRNHDTLGYHGVLGVQPHASSAEIRHAYHMMVKKYHPDRFLNMNSESLKEKLNVVFAYINEAYRELSRSAGTGHARTAPQPEAAPETDKKKLARMKYKEGRSILEGEDSEAAMTLFGQAVYLDSSVPEYHYYYGIALLKNRKIKDAEASIRRAISLSPENAQYMSELGHIYLKLGFRTRARNTFEKALKLDPLHHHAADGLKKAMELQED